MNECINGVLGHGVLCIYRLNWGKRTFSGWWDEWDDTALQTHDLKFDPSGLRLSTLLYVYGGSPQYVLLNMSERGRHFCFFYPSQFFCKIFHLTYDIRVEHFQANTKHLYNICTTPAQRLRRWSNVVQMLYKWLCLLGYWGTLQYTEVHTTVTAYLESKQLL